MGVPSYFNKLLKREAGAFLKLGSFPAAVSLQYEVGWYQTWSRGLHGGPMMGGRQFSRVLVEEHVNEIINEAIHLASGYSHW